METTVSTNILSSTPTKEQIATWDSLERHEQIELMDKAIQEGIESESVSGTAEEIQKRIKDEVIARRNSK